MNVGDRYTSPWGEYVVRSIDPIVLVNGTSAIVAPSSDTIEMMQLVGSGGLPVAVDPRNEKGNGTVAGTADGGGSPSETPAGSEAQADDPSLHAHQLTLGAYRSTMSMAWWPDAQNDRVWTPCLSRSSDADKHEHRTQPHVYFISTLGGSSFCPPCRLKRPRTLHMRDGVVIHDSHADVFDSASLGLAIAESAGAESSASGSFPRGDNSFVSSGAGAESSASELSPVAMVTDCVVTGSGADSPASELLAMAVARDEVPPASDAKAPPSIPLGSEPGQLFPADNVKQSTADFSRAQRTTPIGRAWMGLWEWKEWCAERAAIIEYDGNQPRQVAERRARELAGAAPR